MTVIQVSQRELNRLRVVIDLVDGRLTVDAAAGLMGIGRRQVFRLRRAFGTAGPNGLISKKRRRPSNRRHGEAFRSTVLNLVREHYADFGPTLAAEKLTTRHELQLGVETLRQWMIAAGLWIDRRHHLPLPHQPRRRRESLGELVQIDGSEHAWFERRQPAAIKSSQVAGRPYTVLLKGARQMSRVRGSGHSRPAAANKRNPAEF